MRSACCPRPRTWKASTATRICTWACRSCSALVASRRSSRLSSPPPKKPCSRPAPTACKRSSTSSKRNPEALRPSPMKIHEYQGKQIFQRYGIPTPKGYAAFTAAEVEQGAKKLIDETKIPVVVVKAQIHAGGRGKGGGVKVVKGGPAEAQAVAEKMLGMQLVTK